MELTSRRYPAVMTCVYRLYDCFGRLLYVGIAYDFDTRFGQHEKRKTWWPDVAHRDVTWFASRLDASYAEARAIATEKPVYNDRPGIHPVAFAVVPRERTAREVRNAICLDLEPIVSSFDKERLARAVFKGREHVMVAVEGEVLGVLVDLDWYRRARAAVGMSHNDPTAMQGIEIHELVG